MTGPELYIHVDKASHFLRWERDEFARYFDLVDHPSPRALLMTFGPDVLKSGAALPARQRFAVLFPGFSFNPVRNATLLAEQAELIAAHYAQVFINPGPLELAYAAIPNLTLYPFSVDTSLVRMIRPRTSLDSLLHVSQANPQKDWPRSESIMKKSGLRYEVFPPRDSARLEAHRAAIVLQNSRRTALNLDVVAPLPVGYFDHRETVEKYREYDGFVHVAAEVGHPEFIDGKYTASLIEAGVTGAILFWHDTWGLGNGLETVFNLPKDTYEAAAEIREIRGSLDIERHSRLTSEEMAATFSPRVSVAVRAERMMQLELPES